jgi:hypothetical protein
MVSKAFVKNAEIKASKFIIRKTKIELLNTNTSIMRKTGRGE